MTHRDAGNYRNKHPKDVNLNQDIAKSVGEKTVDGAITCADAFLIADEHKTSIREVGVTIDIMELRINNCQLGLFGYGKGKERLKAAENVNEELKNAILHELINGRLPCESSWKIADKFNISKKEVSSACEALGIKIKPCQLGAF